MDNPEEKRNIRTGFADIDTFAADSIKYYSENYFEQYFL